MKTLGRAGRAALIFQIGFGCGFLVGGILAVANYSKDQRMKAGRHQEVTWIAGRHQRAIQQVKISQTLPGWTAPEAPGQPGVTERGYLDSPGGSKQPLSKLRLHGPSRLDSRPWRPPQDLPRTGPTGIVPQGGTREAGKNYLDSLWTAWEAPGRQERTNWTACEAPGTQERTIWTACEVGRHKGCTRGVKGNPDQGGRKGPFGQPGRHQGGRIGLIGQPARHQGGRKGPIGQPARHQGGRKILTREAG